MNYTALQIAEYTNSKLIGNPNYIIKNILFDSRTIFTTYQTAFIAISSAKNSGEKYIQNAIDKGIKVIICQQKPKNIDKNISYIITENSIQFLQKLSKHHISQFPQLTTIGITGSNGKTIVKEWLYQSLNEDFSVVKSPKSFNSQIGLPISLLQTDKSHQIGIFEVGISTPNEMRVLEEIFSPKIGILTHIGSAHLINFENENQLIKEKISLFKNSEIIFFNGDNTNVFNLLQKNYPNKKLISYGLKDINEVKITQHWTEDNPKIEVSYFGEKFHLPIEQKDEATLNNMLSIIGVMKYLGIENQKIIDKIKNLKSVEMRLESVEGIKNNLIINDSYNLDLDSLSIAYQFINQYNKPEKALILTDFTENKNQSNHYQKVIHLTNEQNFDKIFLIGEEITTFEKDFNSKVFSLKNTNELIHHQELQKIENSLILLKGARKFEIEKIKNILELQKHDTVLEINLNSILHNINVHKALLKPETKIMAMVKAFSYGLGGYEIAEFLQYHHIDYLGVAYTDEGVNLRKHGITTPIMVMNPEQHSYSAIIEYNLEPEIYSFRVLENFCNILKIKGYNGDYPIHIKLETGMNRLGFKEEQIDILMDKLIQYKVRVASIFSHLSSADVPEEQDYTMMQLENFERISNKIIKKLGYKPILHILNSAGITNYTDYQYDMIRIGIGMIGVSSSPKIRKQLQNVVNFKTLISQISEIKEGESIGYSRKYIAKKNTKIATIPVGYADGIPRLVGNGQGYVFIKGEKVPIIGNVCMDMMMIDIGNIPAKEGDEVIIFNTIHKLENFANYSQTIPYEVLTSISRRVKRIFIKD